MYDSEIENRLRTALRAEGDTQPLTITAEELERRLALRCRARSGQRLAIVAAGIAAVLVVALVAVSGGWFRAADVGSGPSAPPAGLPSDAATPFPNAEPSESALPCSPGDPTTITQPPPVILGREPGRHDRPWRTGQWVQVGRRADSRSQELESRHDPIRAD